MLYSFLPGYVEDEEECVQTWSLCRFKGQVMTLLQFCTASKLNYYFFFEEIALMLVRRHVSALLYQVTPVCLLD